MLLDEYERSSGGGTTGSGTTGGGTTAGRPAPEPLTPALPPLRLERLRDHLALAHAACSSKVWLTMLT